jgi:hypothetical protein
VRRRPLGQRLDQRGQPHSNPPHVLPRPAPHPPLRPVRQAPGPTISRAYVSCLPLRSDIRLSSQAARQFPVFDAPAVHSPAASPSHNLLNRLDPNQSAHRGAQIPITPAARLHVPLSAVSSLGGFSDAGRRACGAVAQAADIRNPFTFSTELGCPRHVPFIPGRDRRADIPVRQLRADKRDHGWRVSQRGS